MPIKGPANGYHRNDLTVYMSQIGRAALLMALDHYFHDVVEANVPLEDAGEDKWAYRKIIPSRVNRFNENWCVLFEALAQVKANALDQSPEVVRADTGLTLAWTTRRRGDRDWHPLVWAAEDGEDDG